MYASFRSALRKIMERDDASTKRLVLCVSGIQRMLPTSTAAPSTKQQADAEPEVWSIQLKTTRTVMGIHCIIICVAFLYLSEKIFQIL